MRIQKLNSPQYSTSFCANPIKKATPQKYPDSKNNNYAYCPKMLATALAMATITTGCNINSNKHELQYEKEKYLKSEILTQTNRTNFERNDSIIKDISSQDSINNHFQLLNQLNEENRSNRSFRIRKVNDSTYATKMKLNDRIITTELNFENQLKIRQNLAFLEHPFLRWFACSKAKQFETICCQFHQRIQLLG